MRYRLTCYPCEDDRCADGDEGIWHYWERPSLHDVLRVMRPVRFGGVAANEACLESIDDEGNETVLVTVRRLEGGGIRVRTT